MTVRTSARARSIDGDAGFPRSVSRIGQSVTTELQRMHAAWSNIPRTVLLAVAVMLAGAGHSGATASLAERSAATTSGGTHSPVAVTNPYVRAPLQTSGRTSAHSTTTSLTAKKSSASVSFVGATVDPGAPVVYRLPKVSLFVPIHTDFAASARPWTMLSPEDEEQRSLLTVKRHGSVPTTSELRGPGPRISAPPLELPKQQPVEYARTTVDLTEQLLPAVQRGYELAQRGALFAARAEFVQVLRRIAQAKDAAEDCNDHSRALAAGLRALDEAEDFIPAGIQLEADLNVDIVASSHRTPVLREGGHDVLPHEAAVRYHRYAQQQLTAAVAGEQAGSMALHGIGKIDALVAARNDDDVQLTERASAMYAAALGARPDNHLAANELGVLLCRNGRSAEAVQLFMRTIDAAPSSLAYHNLAVAQRKLGLAGQAAANEHESQRLAARERAAGAVSRREGVTWVSAHEMARVAQPASLAPAISATSSPTHAASVHNAASPTPPNKSPWQRTVEFAKSLRQQRAGSTTPIQGQSSAVPVAQPFVPNQTRWH
jgi:tetratricopeptide (TPR) repeat protein